MDDPVEAGSNGHDLGDRSSCQTDNDTHSFLRYSLHQMRKYKERRTVSRIVAKLGKLEDSKKIRLRANSLKELALGV